MCILPQKFFIKPFDGYIVDFRKIDTESIKASIPILEKVFGRNRKYEGRFVLSLNEVIASSYVAVKDGTYIISTALECAFDEGDDKQSGFFVLIADGNQYRPKDILIWDASVSRWISFNHSKAKILRYNKDRMVSDFLRNNDYWAYLYNKQGVVVRPNNYEAPGSINLTTDCANWYKFPLDSDRDIGFDIWGAWNRGLRIVYDRHAHIARFYSEKLSTWFQRFSNLVYAEKIAGMGYSFAELPSYEFVIYVNKDDFPNLYIQDNKGCDKRFECMKINDYFRGDVREFLSQLKQIVQEYHAANAEKRLLFLQSEVLGGTFYDARDCLMTEYGEYLDE